MPHRRGGRPGLCRACGRFPETEPHIMWQCRPEHLIKFGVPEDTFVKTQAFATRALQELGLENLPGTSAKTSQKQEAFWCRGLFLYGRVSVPPPISAYSQDLVSELAGFQAQGLVCTDGSGLSSDPVRRRCGQAAVLPRADEAPQSWKSIALPLLGHQTVPRAERNIIVVIAQAATGAIELWTDHKPIVDAYKKGLARHEPSANIDLWQLLQETLQAKRVPFAIDWVPSHSEDFSDICPICAFAGSPWQQDCRRVGEGGGEVTPHVGARGQEDHRRRRACRRCSAKDRGNQPSVCGCHA